MVERKTGGGGPVILLLIKSCLCICVIIKLIPQGGKLSLSLSLALCFVPRHDEKCNTTIHGRAKGTD